MTRKITGEQRRLENNARARFCSADCVRIIFFFFLRCFLCVTIYLMYAQEEKTEECELVMFIRRSEIHILLFR